MPRPSLQDTRAEEILDAFMRCTARYGLDGATLERISAEAGVGRPLLRHYLGNRDEMVLRLIEYVARRFEQMTEDLFDALPDTGRVRALMDMLFDREDHSAVNAAVFQALVAASDRYGDIRPLMLNFVMAFERRFADEIMSERPQTDEAAAKIAATGIVAIYFNTAAIMPLAPGHAWRNMQRQAAQGLLDAVQADASGRT